MSKTIFENEVFRIAQKNENDHELYYKGKLLSKVDVSYDGNQFYIKGTPEVLFDFDASMLPPGFQFKLEHQPEGLWGWEGIVTLSVDKKKVQMEFFFCIDNGVLMKADINLFKVLANAMKLASKAGYKVDIDSEDYLFDNRDANFYVSVSPKGNLYQHYKTHLDKLRQYFHTASASVIQNAAKLSSEVVSKPEKRKAK